MTNYSWTSAAGGDFGTGTLWGPHGIPGAADEANFEAISFASYTVTISDSETAGQVYLGDNEIELDVTPNGILNTPTLFLTQGTLLLAGIIENATISNVIGTAIFAGGTLSGATLKGGFGIATGQTLNVENGFAMRSIGMTGSDGLLNILDNETLNTGSVSMGSTVVGGTINAVGTLTLGAAFNISQDRGTAFLTGTEIDNAGMIATSGQFGASILRVRATTFSNTGTINIGVFSTLLDAPSTLGGSVQFLNAGLINVTVAGTLVFDGAYTGTIGGTIAISNGLVRFGSEVSGGVVDFGPSTNGTVELASGMTSTGSIVNFAPGDSIVLDNITNVASIQSAAGGQWNFYDASSDLLGSMAISGTSLNSIAPVVSGGDTILTAVQCFAAGTRIQTGSGEVAVESLQAGDRVLALLAGGTREIIWTGRRGIDCARHPRPEQVWPVRIRAGAFGPGVPHRDLLLSPDHAIYVNEVLIPVRYLINNETITQVEVDHIAYHHLELRRHDVVLAEGLAVESYLDAGQRSDFANAGGVVRLFPAFTGQAVRSAAMWEANACAPLVVQGSVLRSVRRRLSSHSAVSDTRTARR